MGGPRRHNPSYSFADCDFLRQRSLHNWGDAVALADDGYGGRTAEKARISNQDSYAPPTWNFSNEGLSKLSRAASPSGRRVRVLVGNPGFLRSEEHTSELQSQSN